MATTGKDSGNGKEKRGTSPSYLHPTDTTKSKRSPNPSTRSSPDKKHASSSSSAKQIPNYLKPTKSSATDPSNKHPTKKQASNDPSQKPNLNRRRSFDKPPSPSPVQPRVGNLRSLSFSAKTANSPKPQHDRLSRTPKDAGKHHSSRPLSGKKPISIIKKENNTNSGLTKKAASTGSSSNVTNSADIADTEKPDVLQEDQALSVIEAEEEMLHEISDEYLILEDKEREVIVQSVPESQEDEEHLKEVSTVSEEQDSSLGVHTEGPEDKVHVDEIGSDHHEVEDDTKDENNNNICKPEESYTGESQVEGDEKKREEGATENPNEKTVDDKEEADEERKALKSTEIEEEERVVKEVKTKEKVIPNQQGGQGKKDSPAYNDVIEETASKLREQRKNKVKALAGAFETVISLQDPKS